MLNTDLVSDCSLQEEHTPQQPTGLCSAYGGQGEGLSTEGPIRMQSAAKLDICSWVKCWNKKQWKSEQFFFIIDGASFSFWVLA